MKKKQLSLAGLVVCSIVFSPSCAFKESEGEHAQRNTPSSPRIPDSVPNPEPSPTGGADGSGQPEQTTQNAPQPRAVRNLIVKWKRENEKEGRVIRELLVREDVPNYFFVKAPISVPASVPDEISVHLELDPLERLHEGQPIEVKAAASATALAPSQLLKISPAVFNYKVDGTGVPIDLSVSGVRNLLPDSQSSQVFITLEFRELESGFRIGTVQFPIVTPPSQLWVKQATLDEYETNEGKLAGEFHRLSSDAKHWDLVQVVSVNSLHKDPLFLNVPTHPKGKLFQRNVGYFWPEWNDRLLCRQDRKVQERVFEFSKELMILPLTSELASRWVEWAAFETLPVKLGNHEILLGIFAANPSTKDLNLTLKEASLSGIKKKGYPIASTERVPTACDFTCEWPRSGDFFIQCSRIVGRTKQGKCEELVSKCHSCIERNVARGRPWDHPEESGPDCTECRIAEVILDKDISFSPDERNYIPIAPCKYWKTIPRDYATMKFGTEYGPVLLELDTATIGIPISFAPSHQADQTESRKQLFINGLTVQAE